MRLTLLIIFIFCAVNGFSEMKPIDIKTPNSIDVLSISTVTRYSEYFKEWERKTKEKIDQERYAETLQDCKEIEKIAVDLKLNYWLNTVYLYSGICEKNLNNFTIALSYFEKIIHKDSDPFDSDNEKNFQLYRNIAGTYKGMNAYPEAIAYCKKSLEVADKTNDMKAIISIYVNLGIMYSTQQAYEDAKENYIKGINLIKTNDDYISSVIYNNLGNDEYSQGNYAKAAEYYIKSIELSEKTDSSDILAYSYNNLGNIYYYGLKNLDKAFEYYTKSLEIERKANNNEGIANELNNIGNTNALKLKYSEAEESYLEALGIFRSIKNIDEIGNLLENLGILYSKTGNYEKAISTLTECLVYKERNKETKKNASIYNSIGALYYYKKEYSEALSCYFKALASDDKILTKEAYFGIHETYAKMGQYDKAYKYYQYYSTLKDTLLNTTISKQIIDIQEKYERTKMEQKVIMQNLEIENKSLQRNGILSALILSCIVFSGVAYIVLQRRKGERLLFDRNARIKDTEIKNLIKDSEIRSMASMAEGEERERQRISRELHDRVGSMLSLVKLNLSANDDGNNPILSENLVLLDQTYQEVRNISHNLYSGLLRTFGLNVALQNLKKMVETHNSISFNLIIHNEAIIFSKEVNDVIYRIIQELTTNTLKHSSASMIDIQINTTEENVAIVSFEDNGIGFNPQLTSKEGIGLNNIRYRLSTLGGAIEISSSPGNGAFFLLNIPIMTNENKVQL